MTPTEELTRLRDIAAKHPNMRIGNALDRLRVQEKAEEIKRALEAETKRKRLTGLAGLLEGIFS